ncbi:MAG: hypothetical protein K2Q10_01430, partial [Rhodospirillales bacterium]|nr:hypothetical protein [Rhodospirillales bacterium]
MTFFKHLLLGAAVLFAASAPAVAETKSLGKHGDWTAYASGDKAAKVCYMVSQPKKTMGSDKTRGAPLFTISHRPGQSHLFVVSVAAGYEF